MREAALIGLDGMSWHLVLRYKECFNNLLRAAFGGIRGTNWCVPPYTPPSWTSISTGVSPSRHKVFSFETIFGRTRPISSLDIKFPRISEILALNGLRSLVINHIFSYPPEGWFLKNHILVYDDYSPKKFIHPKFLKQTLRYFEPPKARPRFADESYVRELLKSIERRIEGIWKLIDTGDPDFLWVVFKEPDTIMHHLPFVAAGYFCETVGELFSMIDGFIGEVQKEFKLVSIVSDHGFRSYKERINLFGLLAKEGLIQPQGAIANLISRFLESRLMGYVTMSLLRNPKSSRLSYAAKCVVRRILKHSGSDQESHSIAIDPHESDSAFVLYFNNPKLQRTALAILKRYVGTLLEEVRSIQSKEAYILLITPKKEYHFGNIPELSGSCVLRLAGSNHSPEGLFILRAPYFNGRTVEIRNVDIAPTMLAAMKLPLASHFDGIPLIEGQSCRNYLLRWRTLRRLKRVRSLMKEKADS